MYSLCRSPVSALWRECKQLSTHGLSCRKSDRKHHRHAAVNQIIKRALGAAKIPARLEQNGLSRSDSKRPDCARPWSHGQLLVWDATCPDTLALSYRLQACSGPAGERVATAVEHRKTSKYAHLGQAYHFVPVAIETMGACGQKIVLQCSSESLARGLRRRQANGDHPTQCMSAAIQRGNAMSSVMGTCLLG